MSVVNTRGALRLAALACAVLLFTPSRARAEDVASSCADAANAGQPLRRAGQLRAAREQFLRCARDECPDAIRSRCAPWMSEVDAALPSIVIRARDARGADVLDVRVQVDGVDVENRSGVAMQLDPGAHRIRCQAPSGQAHEEDVVVAQGEKNRVLLVTFPEVGRASEAPVPGIPSRRPLVAPPLAYGIGAVGVVALGAFALFEVKAHGGYADLENGCAKTRTCSPSELDDVRRDSTIAVVAGGLGAVALASAIVLLLWRTDETRASALARSAALGELSGRF